MTAVAEAGTRAAFAEARAAVAEAQAQADFAMKWTRAAGAVAAQATEEARVASRRAGRASLPPWLGVV